MCNLQDLSDVSNNWHGIVLFAALKCAFAVKDFGVFLSVHQRRDNISVATDQPPPGPPGPGGRPNTKKLPLATKKLPLATKKLPLAT